MDFIRRIEERYPGIDILFAAEAGSRAWGFSSPDSDFDVRFVFAHKDPNEYLKLTDPVDYLAFNEGDVEYSGWDIKKALSLSAKSNFSLYEWVYSPTVYKSTPYFVESMCGYMQEKYSFREAAHHYRGMAWNTYKTHVAGTGEKTLKKFFYIIRPLLCIEYLFNHEELPPVDFRELIRFSTVDDTFKGKIGDLLEIKINNPEKKDCPPELNEYFSVWIKGKLKELSHDFITEQIPRKETDWKELNYIFSNYVLERL